MTLGIAINGEGHGHFSRARALAEILERRYRIVFWAPEHLAAELSSCFPDAKVCTIPYLKFVQRGFSIDYAKTVSANAGLLLFPGRTCAKIAEELEREQVSAVISDFEPFTSRAAKLSGLPVLQLNHPGVVTRISSLSPAAIASQLVALYMMANSDRTIICSFFSGDVGPIVRSELRTKKITNGDYFVVYRKPLYRDCLETVIEAAGRERFRIFPDPESDYAESLAGCAALIAPAGHQSISEALAIGKPVFAIPVEGQFEQELNALKLRESGFGDYAPYREIGIALPRFIESLPKYEGAIAAARLAGKRGDKSDWTCIDETERAAAMIENFIRDAQRRPEWRRKAPAFRVLFEDKQSAPGA
jgi:hypothetical protein